MNTGDRVSERARPPKASIPSKRGTARAVLEDGVYDALVVDASGRRRGDGARADHHRRCPQRRGRLDPDGTSWTSTRSTSSACPAPSSSKTACRRSPSSDNNAHATRRCGPCSTSSCARRASSCAIPTTSSLVQLADAHGVDRSTIRVAMPFSEPWTDAACRGASARLAQALLVAARDLGSRHDWNCSMAVDRRRRGRSACRTSWPSASRRRRR